jgi:hypothetical protein
MTSSNRRHFVLGLFTASVVACSSSSSPSGGGGGTTGSGSASGTVGGVSYSIADGFAFSNVSPGDGQTNYSLGISLVTNAGVCAFRDANPDAAKSNSGSVFLDLLSANEAIAPGDYPIFAADAGDLTPGNPGASATVESLDGSCSGESVAATDGSVTLTSVDNGTFTGTYTLTFATGSLTGSFSVSACPATNSGGGGSGGQCL